MQNIKFKEISIQQSEKKICVITLSATHRLNALNFQMIKEFYKKMLEYRNNSNITCIFLQGEGKNAFCSGGDIKEIRAASIKNDTSFVKNFFAYEYRLNYLMHTFNKPIICWGNGIVIGGGLGLMSGADFRIVTDDTQVAMPEIGIGLYPDVGGSWILGRMPAHVGLFIALTACNINASDAMYLGLGNRFIDKAFRKNLLSSLSEANWTENAYQVCYQVIQKHVEKSEGWQPYSKVREHRDVIQKIMERHSLDEIMESLANIETNDDWLNKAKNNAIRCSPLSVALAYQQIKRSKYFSLKEVFQSELILTYNTILNGDFCEGVRALLIDKDKQPKWKYNRLKDIPQNEINSYFSSPWNTNPLYDL